MRAFTYTIVPAGRTSLNAPLRARPTKSASPMLVSVRLLDRASGRVVTILGYPTDKLAGTA
jgi:hypothetical protein